MPFVAVDSQLRHGLCTTVLQLEQTEPAALSIK